MNLVIDELKRIVSTWANNIPYSMALFLFGSCLKGKANPSDVDIAIVFTESISKTEIDCIAVEDASIWEKDLAEKTGFPIHLQIYNPGYPGGLGQYLKEGPTVLLCRSMAPQNGEEDFERDLAVLLSKE